MKVLITGATGLIGKKLTQLLLDNDIKVNFLTTSKNKLKATHNLNGFYWNLKTGEIDANCINQVDTIIHLAGASISKRWTTAYKQEIVESRTHSSNLLYNLLKKNSHQVKHIIAASGTAIYPETFTVKLDEETNENENSFLSNVVEKWEQSVDKFSLLGCKVCKLRTGVVLDKNDGALPQMAKPIQNFVGASIGSGKQMLSWIHIDDIVAMYYFALNNQLEGIYNAVAPNTVSNYEITKAIAKQFKKPIILPNVPSFVLKIILGEMAYLVLSSKNLSSKKIVSAGFKFKFPDIYEALQNIYK